MGALIPFAQPENRLVIGAATGLFAVAAGGLVYRIAVRRLDLAPLTAFAQELRAGLNKAEQAAADDEDFEP